MDMYQKREMRKNKKMNESTKSLPSTSINWFPGHMQKTKRLISEKLPLVDIVYELVDARIPYSSKIKDINDIIKEKPKILIMTKKDLCDLKVTYKWASYYEKEGYKVLLVNLNDNNDYKKIVELTNLITEEIQRKRLEKGMEKKEIKALVVGIPNVGKSTLINRMAGKKVTIVGNKPGVTKSITWLKTSFNILLLDTPGILWPKFDNDEIALNLASMSAIKSEILNEDDVACHIIKKLCENYPKFLTERYKVSATDDIMTIYEKIAKNIGAYKNGEVIYEKVSNKIINDLKNEYIKEVTFDNGI